MAIDFRAELAFMFRDVGKSIRYGAQHAYGIYVEVGEVVFDTSDGPVLATAPTVKLPTGSLHHLERDAEIFVEGSARKINQHYPIRDGSITLIELRKA